MATGVHDPLPGRRFILPAGQCEHHMGQSMSRGRLTANVPKMPDEQVSAGTMARLIASLAPKFPSFATWAVDFSSAGPT